MSCKKKNKKEKKQKLQQWGLLHSITEGTKNFPLTQKRNSIGRYRKCNLVINQPKLSKIHCTITLEKIQNATEGRLDHIVYLQDHSTNGTYLNNQLIGKGNKVKLRHKDEITLNHCRLTHPTPKYGFLFDDYLLCPRATDESELSRIKLSPIIGKGGYGSVYLWEDFKTKTQYAVKVIEKIKVIDRKKEGHQPKHINYANEITLLKEIDHHGIIKLYEVKETDTEIYLFMEYVKGKTLLEYIIHKINKEKIPYTEKEAQKLFKNILKIVKYLHQKGIVHRDLKPDNLILTGSKTKTEVKLCDFGFSRIIPLDGNLSTKIGTEYYVAPEVLLGKKYGKECDLWSTGVLLYIILSGNFPFHPRREDNIDLQKQILDIDFYFYDGLFDDISPAAKNLINRLILGDPKSRLNAEEALSHSWVIGKGDLISDENYLISEEIIKRKKVQQKQREIRLLEKHNSSSFSDREESD
ncbi:serine/threonine-protein kinase dclk3 [Anaeramoeba flamelloides]|uniref:Serine/threonine-protein kinase dclk3 n=1 Tax=Anaeramoeba flamelloides TaxID=1746091 RepID=A0ABQ8ZAW0_9EUKA|nr:serine/threonine-protein kinase dclk3 [Anaeramoeba flamelloides]